MGRLNGRIDRLEQAQRGKGRHLIYKQDLHDETLYHGAGGELLTRAEIDDQAGPDDTVILVEYRRDWPGEGR